MPESAMEIMQRAGGGAGAARSAAAASGAAPSLCAAAISAGGMTRAIAATAPSSRCGDLNLYLDEPALPVALSAVANRLGCTVKCDAGANGAPAPKTTPVDRPITTAPCA